MRFRDLHEALRLEIVRRLDSGLLTGSELARRTGFRQAHISNFLHAKRSLSLTGLDRVLTAIDLTVDDVLQHVPLAPQPIAHSAASAPATPSASNPDGGSYMDSPALPAVGPRRNEDIALDLLKFVAGTAGLGRNTPGSTGFTAPSPGKPDDQITQLLELYARCLKTVEGK